MFKHLRQAVRLLSRGGRVNREIDREVEFHLQMEIEHRIKTGVSPAEARRTALRDFGGADRVREEMRDARGFTFWDGLLHDVRYGIRSLRGTPGYTSAAILILGLGIGANTAMFSVINGVLLKPLPFRDGDRLALIQQSAPASNASAVGVSVPELYDYRARLQSVTDLVEYHGMSFTLLNQGEPDRVDTGVVSANFFDVLGIHPALGRTFVSADDQPGAAAVLVLSHPYWIQKFGGDRSIVGRVLQMNNRPHTIVGVLPDFPQYPRDNDVYMPTSACPFRSAAESQLQQTHRAFGALRVFGRLAQGIGPDRASSEIAAISATFARDHAKDYGRLRGLTGRAQALQETLVQDARPMLLALGGTTLLVLLLACANVANLAMGRMARRSRELAVRAVLGAGRVRLLRQLVTESLLIALAGGLLGLGFAWLTSGALVAFIARFTPRTAQIAIDGWVLTFTVIASIVTGIAFGAAPALAKRKDPIATIRASDARAGESARKQWLRSFLVVAQVAVSFALLIGAALLLQSFYRLSVVRLGYDASHVETANVFGNFTRLDTNEKRMRFQSDVLERLRGTPGVHSAAVTGSVPLSNITPALQTIRLERDTGTDHRTLRIDPNVASDGYFETLDVPVLSGRTFRDSDDMSAPLVAVINASAAKMWGAADPVGMRFIADGLPAPPNRTGDVWFTVIGIVADFHLYSVDQEVEPQFYTTFRQMSFGGGQLLARADGDPSALASVLKNVVHAVDPQIPVEQIQSLEALRRDKLTSPATTATLLAIFAGIALLLSLAGLAGVVATSVNQRTREFGVRMALGASRASVLQLVLGQGIALVFLGLVAGIAGAYGFSRLLAKFLFATAPTDVRIYVVVAALFAVAALAATLAPARRATTIDPLIALRAE